MDPGPEAKGTAWHAASGLVGWALLILLVDWITGSLLEIGFGRAIVLFLILGALLSLPHGLAWLRGEAAPPRRRTPPAPAAEVRGETGATYVFVRSGRRGLRPRELGPGWYALHTAFWRWPLSLGDLALVGAWRLVGRASGVNGRPVRSGEVVEQETTVLEERSPDRNLF